VADELPKLKAEHLSDGWRVWAIALAKPSSRWPRCWASLRFAERPPIAALAADELTLFDRYLHAGGEQVARADLTTRGHPDHDRVEALG
jgi:hypothetical protein